VIFQDLTVIRLSDKVYLLLEVDLSKALIDDAYVMMGRSESCKKGSWKGGEI
jgi:hypothetical protein